MCVRISCVLFVTFAVGIPQSLAQFTTVQLPTLQNFSMSTTVVVPDRGSVHAGGISRSARMQTRRGTPLLPLASASSAAVEAASGVTVSAWVHDLEAMDREILRQWKAEQSASNSGGEDAKRPATTRTPIADANPEAGRPRVSQIRRQIEAERKTKLQHGHRFFATADRLHRKGKLAAARTVYRNAYRYGDEQLQARVAARVRAIDAVANRSTPNNPATINPATVKR